MTSEEMPGDDTPDPDPRLDSEAKRAYKRKEHDAFDTPPECALACAQWCAANLDPGGSDASRALNVLDPMAGGGPFVLAARTTWPGAKIVAVDIRPEVAEPLGAAGASSVIIRDFLTVPAAAFAKVDLVLTNPAFVLADALLRHLWPGLKDGASVAFLLPVTFIGSDDRWDNAGLYASCPLRHMAPIVPRPSFLTIEGKPTSPKFEAALFVWTKGWAFSHNPDGEYNELPATIPGPIRWTKPRKKRVAKS